MGIENELMDVPSKGYLLWQLFLLLGVTLCVFAFYMPAVRRIFFPEEERTKLAHHLGYERIGSDGRTVECRDGTIFQVVRVRGLDTDALGEDQQFTLFMRRKSWLTGLSAGGGIPFEGRLIFIDTRRVVDLSRHTHQKISHYIDRIFTQYMRRFSRSYRNTHYVVVVVPGTATHKQEQLDTAIRNMVRQLGSIETSANSYGAEPLSLGRKGTDHSPLLTYLAQMVNPGFTTYVRQDALGANRVADVVCQSRVAFENKELDIRPGDGIGLFSHKGTKCWMGAVMLHTSAIRWNEKLPKRLLSLDQKLILTQWIRPMDQRESQEYVKNFLKSNDQEDGVNRTSTVDQELLAGKELVERRSAEKGELFFNYEMTVFVLGDTRNEVVKGIAKVTEAIEDCSFTAVQVTSELDERWFSMHPPYITDTRPLTPFTSNVANLVCFPSPQQGYDKSDWGRRPIQYFHTAAKSAYGFIFHATDTGKAAGHTGIFGETGGGKTVLQNLLAASALAHPDARVFIFDRFDSSYVFTKACGGKYILVDTSHDTPNDKIARLNPFSLDIREDGTGDTPFVIKWLSEYTLRVDDADSIENITRILRQMSKLSRSARNMTEFARECPSGSALETAAKRWIKGGDYGHIYSDKPDSLNFDGDCRLFTFDATRFLEHTDISQSIISYISYRIEKQVSELGCPWTMILDETKALLVNERFREWFTKLHDEARRLRGVIISSFQRISQAAKTGALSTVREACNNHIFLPNPDGDRAEYMDLMNLGDREFAAVKKLSDVTSDMGHFILLRRRNEGAVILSTDLSDLNKSEDGPLLQLFESGPEAANMFRQFEREFGEGEAAVKPYLAARAAKLKQEGEAGFRLEEAAE